jgi:hypothetical protein
MEYLIRSSQKEMKVVVGVPCIAKETLGGNYNETYEMWSERNTMKRNNMGTKLLLNRLYWMIKAERTIVDGIDGIKAKVRLRV